MAIGEDPAVIPDDISDGDALVCKSKNVSVSTWKDMVVSTLLRRDLPVLTEYVDAVLPEEFPLINLADPQLGDDHNRERALAEFVTRFKL